MSLNSRVLNKGFIWRTPFIFLEDPQNKNYYKGGNYQLQEKMDDGGDDGDDNDNDNKKT
ncbi:unnamed protein product [Cunninghamella echinulata]